MFGSRKGIVCERFCMRGVSSADQRADLDRQKLRLLEYAQHHRIQVDEVIVEVGSGLDGSRRKLLGVLSKPGLGIVLVEHRDRLARFGFELVDALLRARGGGVLVDPFRGVWSCACGGWEDGWLAGFD